MLITQKSNWFGIAEENHDILTFRNRKDVRDHLIKSIILDVREMRTRKESGLCKTHSESVSDQNHESSSNVFFCERREYKHSSKKPLPQNDSRPKT